MESNETIGNQNIEEQEQTPESVSVENNEDNEKNSVIQDRLKILNTLTQLIEKLKGESIGEITYLRIKSGLDYLTYEFNSLIEHGLDRELNIDDLSAKEIAGRTKIRKTDSRDITVKDGIDKEIEYICNFIDQIIESKDKVMTADDMIKFIQDQSAVDGIIENYYKKG